MKYKTYKGIKFDYEKMRKWDHALKDKVFNMQYCNSKGLVVIDVGANTGAFADLFAKSPENKLYLFEPVPEIYAYCAWKFAKNKNVQVEKIALSDRKAKEVLWVDSFNLGWNTMEEKKASPDMRPIRVCTDSFDEYARKHKINRIDLIKIDVEGAEYKVLAGMRKTISRLQRKPLILCEVGWGRNHPYRNKEVAEIEWLFVNGYERVEYDFDCTKDLLFVPKENTSNLTANLNKSFLERITIGVPTRNRKASLFRLVDSLNKQTYKNFDLIISDDGDKFDLKSEIKRTFPTLEFRYIKGKGESLPVNRQSILDNAQTELVLMCDDDHVLKEDCVEILVKTIKSNPRAGIVAAIWPNKNAPTVNYAKFKNKEEFLLTLDNLKADSDPGWINGRAVGWVFHKPAQVLDAQFCGGGCLIYRKSAVKAAGGFPDYYSRVSFREDTDLSYRVYLAGYKVLINTSAIACHYQELEGGTRDTKERKRLMFEDGRLFLKKFFDWKKKFKSTGKNNILIEKFDVLATRAIAKGDYKSARSFLLEKIKLAPDDFETARLYRAVSKQLMKQRLADSD